MNYKKFVQDYYQHGEMVPLWKGYVHSDIMRCGTRVAPLGFNILFAFGYGILWRIRMMPVDYGNFAREQQSLRRK